MKKNLLPIHKKCLALIIAIFLAQNIQAQPTFNQMNAILDVISAPLYIVPDTSNIYCIGFGTKDNPYDHYGIFFARFDLEGNLLNKSYYEEDETKFFGFYSVNDAFIDGNEILFIIRRDEIDFGYLVRLNKVTGSIIAKYKISNDFNGEGTIVLKGLEKISDNEYSIISTITEKNPIDVDSNFYYINLQISIFNSLSNTFKHHTYGEEKSNENARSFIWTGRSYIVSDLKTSNRFYEEGYKARSILYELDTIGNHEIVYSTHPDSLRDYILDISMANDGGYVMTNSKVKQYYIDGWHEYILLYKPYVFKLDSNYNEVWETDITGTFSDYHPYNEVVRIMPTKERDGYVVAGRVFNNIIPGTLFEGDSLYAQGKAMSYGLLSKVLNDGIIDWTRYYSIVGDTTGNLQNTHNIVDCELSLDGGYVMTGEVNYWGIKTWILKVDEYGCLVPGCQDTTSVSDYNIEALPVMVYPNPASDHLYIYQSEEKALDFEIFDLQGRMMESFRGNRGQETHIVSLIDYPSGCYMLRVRSREGRIATKRFVKK